jgi:hypothetical protein
MRRAKVDSNHAAIVLALQQIGCSVESLAAVGKGCPDLLCGYQGRNVLLEVKTVAGVKRKGTTADLQRSWRDAWRGGLVWVVTSADEAINAILGDACV